MIQRKRYTFKAEVWLYPGAAAWHFVSVNAKHSKVLKARYGKGRPGFGSIPVEVAVGKTVWNTSIFPDRKSGTYLLPIKTAIRAREGFCHGDTITVSLTPRP